MGSTILAVMTDLFFLVKISDAAKKLGMTVELVKDRELVLEKLREKPALIIFDLNCEAIDPVELIRTIKSNPAAQSIRTIGFVSHVQTDLRVRARESGCDEVVARSAFAQNLPAFLE